MRNVFISITVLSLFLSCKSNQMANSAIIDPVEVTMPEQQTESVKVNKKDKILDDFVGKWQNVENDNEIINLEKKYDNVYQLGGLTLYRKYADDGTVYLSGEFEEYGAEVQVLFDNHTQHLILRHPADFREYRKTN
ncbi:hypothetical protein D3C80_1491830 [compost metagenome]